MTSRTWASRLRRARLRQLRLKPRQTPRQLGLFARAKQMHTAQLVIVNNVLKMVAKNIMALIMG